MRRFDPSDPIDPVAAPPPARPPASGARLLPRRGTTIQQLILFAYPSWAAPPARGAAAADIAGGHRKPLAVMKSALRERFAPELLHHRRGARPRNGTGGRSDLGRWRGDHEILAFTDFGVENLVELVKIRKELKSRREP
ncbi:hypothetical protein [Methylosinus sp. LW3]|uniref:hypothetical protein n=1 Tax=Methylosinus sp. LW3 TaxID=107635 RepID=UPI0018DD43CE|nr:hypothetical protein [Methylosinus sp. LW3]